MDLYESMDVHSTVPKEKQALAWAKLPGPVPARDCSRASHHSVGFRKFQNATRRPLRSWWHKRNLDDGTRRRHACAAACGVCAWQICGVLIRSLLHVAPSADAPTCTLARVASVILSCLSQPGDRTWVASGCTHHNRRDLSDRKLWELDKGWNRANRHRDISNRLFLGAKGFGHGRRHV